MGYGIIKNEKHLGASWGGEEKKIKLTRISLATLNNSAKS